MKAAVYSAVRKLSILQKPKPAVEAGEALIKVEACGICGSDVHGYLHGLLVQPGTVMGHEFSGLVEEVGQAVEGFIPGDRVVGYPICACGICLWCRSGQENLCPAKGKRSLGYNPLVDGAYAEYVKIPVPSQMLFRLPEGLSFEQGALIEPLSTAYHAVRLSRFKPGDTALVMGAGPIGLGTLQFLKMGGARQVMVLEISSERAAIALTLGGDMVLNPRDEGKGLAKKIREFSDGLGPDFVFECTGAPEPLQNAIHYVKRGGQIVLVGIIESPVSILPLNLAVWEVNIQGSFGYTRDEFQRVIDLVSQKRIKTDSMISASIPLEEIEEKGFKRLASSADAVKILVRP
ncbi:MAG: alcohol dehydrogenase catalytic domain-containing protein [Thermodesulfobacteriota bacterium]